VPDEREGFASVLHTFQIEQVLDLDVLYCLKFEHLVVVIGPQVLLQDSGNPRGQAMKSFWLEPVGRFNCMYAQLWVIFKIARALEGLTIGGVTHHLEELGRALDDVQWHRNGVKVLE
jgi:hypothetical protein